MESLEQLRYTHRQHRPLFLTLCFCVLLTVILLILPFLYPQNEWVICRVFKKSSGGKKIHISGLARESNHAADNDSGCSELPPLMDLSSDEAQTRTTVGDASHVTCFSNPMEVEVEVEEDQKPLYNLINNNINITPSSYITTSSSKASVFSPASQPFPRVSTPNSYFSSHQINPYMENLQCADSIFMQDQSILKLLLEDYGPNLRHGTKTELSHDTDRSSSPMSNHGIHLGPRVFQECPITTVGQVDLDYLWNY